MEASNTKDDFKNNMNKFRQELNLEPRLSHDSRDICVYHNGLTTSKYCKEEIKKMFLSYKNIKHIEKMLNLRINARGNILCIKGENADKAKNIIESLINLAKNKITIDNEEVEAAIRFCENTNEIRNRDLFIKTPKKRYC